MLLRPPIPSLPVASLIVRQGLVANDFVSGRAPVNSLRPIALRRHRSPSLAAIRHRFAFGYHPSCRAHSDWAKVPFKQEIHGAGVAPWIRVWTRFVLDQVSLLDGSGKLFF